jgi:hypothetical protein
MNAYSIIPNKIKNFYTLKDDGSVIDNLVKEYPPTNYTSKVPGKRSCNLLHG